MNPVRGLLLLLLLLLGLLPLSGLAQQTNIWLGSAGNPTNNSPSQWSLGRFPTNGTDIVVFDGINGSNIWCRTTMNIDCSEMIFTNNFVAGLSVQPPAVVYIRNRLVGAAPAMLSVGNPVQINTSRLSAKPLVVTVTNFLVSGWYPLTVFSAPNTPVDVSDAIKFIVDWVAPIYLAGTNAIFVIANVTNTYAGTRAVEFLTANNPGIWTGGSKFIISNVYSRTVTFRELSLNRYNTWEFVNSTVGALTGQPTGTPYPDFLDGGATVYATNTVFWNIGGARYAASAVLKSHFSAANARFEGDGFSSVTLTPTTDTCSNTVFVSNTGTIVFNMRTAPIILTNQPHNLQAASSAPVIRNASTLSTLGYALAGNTIEMMATLLGSTSTITVSNFVRLAGTFIPGTSTIRLLPGGSSNLTNYFHLTVTGGWITLTNAHITIGGRLRAETNGVVDGVGGTLTLGVDSVFAGQAYNLTIRTNSRPLTVYRGGTNTTGNIWHLPRMGSL